MRQDPGCLIGGKEPSISALIDYDGSCGKPVQRIPFDELNARTGELHSFVRERIPLVTGDRRQDIDIQQVLELHRAGRLPGIGRGEGLDPKLVAEGGASGGSA